MSNEFLSSFAELLDVQAEVMGSRPTASIGGVTVDVIIEEPGADQSLDVQSFNESGTTTLQCLASPFDSRPIKFQTPVILGDRKLQVVNIPVSNHGIYRFMVGDPSRQ